MIFSQPAEIIALFELVKECKLLLVSIFDDKRGLTPAMIMLISSLALNGESGAVLQAS
jgi:hypothetical protein